MPFDVSSRQESGMTAYAMLSKNGRSSTLTARRAALSGASPRSGYRDAAA